MKWFLVLIVVLNLAVAGYGSFKQRPPADVHAQEISPEQVKLLPADWQPASAPAGDASAPLKVLASMPQTEALKPEDLSKAASQPVAAKPAKTEASATTAKAEVKNPPPAKLVEKPAEKTAEKPKTEAIKPEPSKALACYDWGTLDAKLLTRVKGGLPGLKLKPEQLVESSKGEVKANGKFWVYHPPLATQSETQTLSAELKDKGFDNYIVHSAEFKGSVSLGLFGQESAAKAMQAKVKAAGFDKVAVEQKGQKSSATVLRFKALDPQQAERLQALQKRLTPGIALQACR
ncbi:SPOR domain-containing protein [Aquitalea sp. LB_tupeE]|uniref:SPOR domain-containing protein n=1 Tax=Aquitalea sp. LB_tupeE TaxID=2748078 RepID=UPI0015BBD654|nr:SPOR domain-containing protein [Aquitalea sp. LB_tupeE]NWK77906.1 SPOR domain-containing protein [Aquitalea sp. LB_tupeE]